MQKQIVKKKMEKGSDRFGQSLLDGYRRYKSLP